MFEARFTEASMFRKLVDALRDFKDINLECSQNGISLKVMDECHVSLADMFLSANLFESYRCDAPCTIGLNVETLARVIKQAPGERALVLRKSNDMDRLRIESDEDAETGLQRAADISLITVSGESLQLPDQQYQVEIEIPTKVYGSMIKDLTGVADDLRISVTAKAIKFEAEGQRGRVENVFRRGEGSFISSVWTFEPGPRCFDIVEQVYAIRFLAGFSKACPLSETVNLNMSIGVPLRLQFPLGEDSYLAYYAAPALE